MFSAAASSQILTNLPFRALNFLLPFYLIQGIGLSASRAGLFLVAISATTLVLSPIAGRISDKVGTSLPCALGVASMCIGMLLLGRLGPSPSLVAVVLGLLVFGTGMAIFEAPNTSAIMGSVPPQRLGVASGLMALSRNLGTTVWMPIMGAVFTAIVLSSAGMPSSNNVIDAPAQALVKGVTGAYRIAAMILLVSTILAFISFVAEKKKGRTEGNHREPFSVKENDPDSQPRYS